MWGLPGLPSLSLAGFVVDPSPGDLDPAARASRRAPYTHVVAYHRSTSALRGTADSLLDAASYGSRWVLLSPAAAPGVAVAAPRALRSRGNTT